MIPGWLYAVMGVFTLVLVTVEVVWVTLTLERGGPVTRITTRYIGRLIEWAIRLPVLRRMKLLAGPLVALTVVSVWVMLAWTGWYSLFSASEASLEFPDSDQIVRPADRAYFVGFTMITLGTGDVVSTSPLWDFLSVAMSTHGFFLITLSITYLLPLVQTVVAQRTFAIQITALGKDPAQLVRRAAEEDEVDLLAERLTTLGTALAALDRAHKAYPVLHFYQNASKDESMPVAVFRLLDTCLLMECALRDELRPPWVDRQFLRRILFRYAATWELLCGRGSSEAPPLPDLAAIPGGFTVPETEFRQRAADWEEARRRLAPDFPGDSSDDADRR